MDIKDERILDKLVHWDFFWLKQSSAGLEGLGKTGDKGVLT